MDGAQTRTAGIFLTLKVRSPAENPAQAELGRGTLKSRLWNCLSPGQPLDGQRKKLVSRSRQRHRRRADGA